MSQPRKKVRDLSVADPLRLARTELGLTQGQAAERWGISRRTLEKWETGERIPRGFARTQLEKLIAGVLGDTESSVRRKTGPKPGARKP